MKGKAPQFTGMTKLGHTMAPMKKGGVVKGKKHKAKEMGKVEGKKAMRRLDKKSRGGAVDGRPNPDGMSAESPMSSASKSESEDGRGYKRGGRLTAEERHKLPKKDFALPGERYPIPDKAHARNADSRVAQHGTPEEKKKVRAAVHRKFPGIKQKD